jgi:hypothetical protein
VGLRSASGRPPDSTAQSSRRDDPGAVEGETARARMAVEDGGGGEHVQHVQHVQHVDGYARAKPFPRVRRSMSER